MKTLGQIAFEASRDAVQRNEPWPASWEAAAQAVRASVIEECARYVEDAPGLTFYDSAATSEVAFGLRLLKEKKET
jgi:hypothetical protein